VTSWLPERRKVENWPLDRLDGWLAAFQTLQAWEAWQSHGTWLEGRLDTLGADVRGRFEAASRVTEEEAAAARGQVDTARKQIRQLVGDRFLVLPSAAGVAPYPADGQAHRDATMRLTCLAGLAGLPAVSIPVTTGSGLPAGISVVAAPGRDRDLLTHAMTGGH
jgi:Asp-tRNA(Asn)/Glu-tRNA(Gln) amidotransferase A subunit family amidase